MEICVCIAKLNYWSCLVREEAQRVWEKREAEWEKERRARERLMQEVSGPEGKGG